MLLIAVVAQLNKEVKTTNNDSFSEKLMFSLSNCRQVLLKFDKTEI